MHIVKLPLIELLSSTASMCIISALLNTFTRGPILNSKTNKPRRCQAFSYCTRSMAVEMPVSQVQPVKEVSEAEIRQWFERHQSLLIFPFDDRTTTLEEKITNFQLWFERYLADKEYYKNEEVETFAEEYKRTRVMTWIWMNTEYVKDAEVASYIKQAAELFHKKFAANADRDQDQHKTNISEIVNGLYFAFRDIEGPRVAEALEEAKRRLDPDAQVPHNNSL